MESTQSLLDLFVGSQEITGSDTKFEKALARAELLPVHAAGIPGMDFAELVH
jgi:hypothetical protein